MALLSPADEVALRHLVPELELASRTLRIAQVAPDRRTRCAAMDIIVQFVRDRKRKVYGGQALNAAVWARSAADAFYGPPPWTPEGRAHAVVQNGPDEPADIEFYSPDAVQDAMQLSDMLVRAGHTFVQAREASHVFTYTVTVDFVRLCDITYVPRRVYQQIPAQCWGGVWCITPHFQLVDVLRQYCDPVISHWRIGQVLSRLALSQRMFGIMEPDAQADAATASPPLAGRSPTPFDVVLEQLRRIEPRYDGDVEHGVLGLKSVAWIGSVACAQLFANETAPSSQDPVACLYDACARVAERIGLEAVSTAYEDDVACLSEHLARRVPGMRVDHHEPFLDWIGRRCVFYSSDGAPLLTLYDHAGRAVPCVDPSPRLTPLGANVACFAYVLLMTLMRRFLARVDGDHATDKTLQRCAHALLHARQACLAASSRLVTDEASLLRDVKWRLMGPSASAMVLHMQYTALRRERFGQVQAWFKYTPVGAGGGRMASGIAARYRHAHWCGQPVVNAEGSHADRTREAPSRKPAKKDPPLGADRRTAGKLAPQLEHPGTTVLMFGAVPVPVQTTDLRRALPGHPAHERSLT